MKEKLSEDMLKQLGQCKVCGEQAYILVYDIMDITKPADAVRICKPFGEVHRFCRDHERPSITYDLRIGVL